MTEFRYGSNDGRDFFEDIVAAIRAESSQPCAPPTLSILPGAPLVRGLVRPSFTVGVPERIAEVYQGSASKGSRRIADVHRRG